MLDQPTRATDLLRLSELEQTLLIQFLRKKRVRCLRLTQVSVDFLEMARTNPIKRKKREKSYKFLLNKAIPWLKLVFNATLYPKIIHMLSPSLKGSRNAEIPKEYAFYGYYFGRTAMENENQIEEYFYPDSREVVLQEKSWMRPKTISKEYISKLGQSPRFREHLWRFFDYQLVPLVSRLGVVTLHNMIRCFDARLGESSAEGLLTYARSKYWENPKCKLPWSVSEVQLAREQLRMVLDESSECSPRSGVALQ